MENEVKIVDKAKKEINSVLDNLLMNDVKLKDITIRVGNKVLKYEMVNSGEYSLDNEIREEYSRLISDKMKEIRGIINIKFNDTLRVLQSVKEEYIRKEFVLKNQLKNISQMPNIGWNTARMGLSVFKGDQKGEINWLVCRTYKPKTVDFIPIKPNYIDKLERQIYIMVTTIDDTITAVSTRRMVGLELFQHYHQASPDCWGQWKYHRKWDKPKDIIKIADEAEAVLENINSGSVARQEPVGMPTISVLKRNLATKESAKIKEDIIIVPSENTRVNSPTAEDVWII